MSENKANEKKKMSREEYLYHNTEILLKKYRDVVWSVEVSAIQAKFNLELEMDCKLEEFLEMSYEVGIDLSRTNIAEQARTLERNRKMLEIIKNAVDIIRERWVDGEMYYWIIYYTYLSEKPCKSIDDILTHIGMETVTLSRKTYFKKREKAIMLLGDILWGYTSKDSLSLLAFFEKTKNYRSYQ